MGLTMLLFHLSKAQSLNEAVRLRADVTIISDATLELQAKENARHLIIAYSEDDPYDLQNVIDNLEGGWFVDMDVFLGSDLDSVIESIMDTPHAAFMEHKGKVLIDVSETYDICMVTIYCL